MSSDFKDSFDSVFLCTTPLQARICLAIIKKLNIHQYCVLYVTRNNTDLDRNYFKKLSKGSGYSQFLHIKHKIRGVNTLITLAYLMSLDDEWMKYRFSNIYIASIDSMLFRYFLSKNLHADFFSYDDGTANFNINSSYHKSSKKNKVFSCLMGIIDIKFLKRKIIKHYSIFPGFKNILPEGQVECLSLFEQLSYTSDRSKTVSFFVGQPFAEYLSPKQILKLRSWLNNNQIDYYIKHPREVEPIIKNIPILNKKGMLAEDAIFNATGDSKPTIISCYSTVLFNINNDCADKTYLSISGVKNENEHLKMIKKLDMRIILIN